MQLDIFARESHHKEHAMPLAAALNIPIKDDIADIMADYVCVFCYGDLKLITKLGKKIIFFDHGVGMYYANNHPSYAGSTASRDNVVLRLSPNEIHAQKERETLSCPVEVIGVPKLDKYATRKWRFRRRNPVIAISFHWDCLVNQETRSSLDYFESALPELTKRFKVYGHGHPRIMNKLRPIYRKYGIIVEEDFDKILKKADIYICDNSSTIFEWCITEKPIVLLNPPFYRKYVEHEGNPRFWKHADIAPLVNKPKDLISAIDYAIQNHHFFLPRIVNAKNDVLTITDGTATQKAIEMIKKHIGLSLT